MKVMTRFLMEVTTVAGSAIPAALTLLFVVSVALSPLSTVSLITTVVPSKDIGVTSTVTLIAACTVLATVKHNSTAQMHVIIARCIVLNSSSPLVNLIVLLCYQRYYYSTVCLLLSLSYHLLLS